MIPYKLVPALNTKALKEAFRVQVPGHARTFATQYFSSVGTLSFYFPPYFFFIFFFLRARRIDLLDVWGEEAKAKSVIAAPNTFNTIKFSSFGAIKDRKEWQTF